MATGKLSLESDHQKKYFSWVREMREKDGRYKNIFATFNGAWVAGTGSRKFALINSYKAQGLENGVLDIVISCPCGPYHGMYIELKKPDDYKVSLEQEDWIRRHNWYGYRAIVCFGWESAKKNTEIYFALGEFNLNTPRLED